VEIYGALEHDAELVTLCDNVRRHGIRTPLQITADGLIIAGHRRWRAAQVVGLTEVPVIVIDADDERELLVLLITDNASTRTRTNEQKAREMQALLPVETELAKERIAHGGPNGSAPVHYRSKASEAVAKAVGVSPRTVSYAVPVAEALDRADAEGATQVATTLRTTLNERGFKPAFQAAHQAGFIPPENVTEPSRTGDPIDDLLITLPVWRHLSAADRQRVLERPRSHTFTMNLPPNDSVEWARRTYSPVTGCLHNCSYCFAENFATRFYPQGFVPTFLPERLDGPRNTPFPSPEALARDPGLGIVFVTIQGDLFGQWVPREWIAAVLASLVPPWTYILLTKFPQRLAEFSPFPSNVWVGTSVDAQARVTNAEDAFEHIEAPIKWLSCEPLLEPLKFSRLHLFDWMVIGGASASNDTPEWRPPRSWVLDLERQAHAAHLMVFEKTNLWERTREWPGHPTPPHLDVPEEFKMKYLQRDILEPELYIEEMDA
jgi:protein gp37